LYGVEWPLRTFATLQRLHLLPFSSSLSQSHTLGFLATGFTQLPTLTSESSWNEYISTFVKLAASPFFISYLGEMVRGSLHHSIRTLIQPSVSLCGRSDDVSLKAAPDEDPLFEAISIWNSFSVQPNYGVTFIERLQDAFPFISAVVRRLGTTDGGLLAELRQSEATRQHDSSHSTHAAADDASTATPEPADLFERADDEDGVRSPRPGLAHEPFSNNNTELHALLEPTEIPQSRFIPLPLPGESPPTGPPGISRAPTLEQAAIAPNQPVPRPVRRPTELDDNISSVAQALQQETRPRRNRATLAAWRSPRPSFSGGSDVDDHRVRSGHMPPSARRSPRVSVDGSVDDYSAGMVRRTSLSTFPGDAVAHYGAVFITSLVMLPFDVYYTRRLARAWLASGRVGADLPGWAVAPSQPVLRGLRGMSMGLIGEVGLTYGLEVILRQCVLTLLTKTTGLIGKRYFMWGKV
jgi:hypothetical protein